MINGFEENTIVIFTSDNGTEHYAFARGETHNHFSMGSFRGLKRDIWEGGHRVPFIIKWPGHIQSGIISDKLVSQIDIMATLGDLIGIELKEGVATDSFHFLPELSKNPEIKAKREFLVHNTFQNRWAVRNGDWLYINDSTGQHSVMPESFSNLMGYSTYNTSGLLFNLKEDPEQRINLFESHPELIANMDRMLSESKSKGYLIKDK